MTAPEPQDRQPTSLRLTRRDRALLDALQAHTGLSLIGVIRLGLVSTAKLLGVPAPAEASSRRSAGPGASRQA